MPRKETPSYVVDVPLTLSGADERRLEGVFTAAARLNNVLLKDGLAIVDAIRSDPLWGLARELPARSADQRKARGEAFKAVRRAHGFRDYDFQALAIEHKNAAGFAARIGTHVAQKLGTKVFRALERYLLKLGGRPRFKGRVRPLHSIEGKNNTAALRWDADERMLVLNKAWGLRAAELRLDKDEWLWSALQGEVKYCRLLWRNVGGHRRYYAQLVFDGLAPVKASVLARLAEPGSTGGIDIGPSNIAWVSGTDAGLFKFCAEVDAPRKLIKRLQRRVDRQRRANNPGNFDERGRALRGKKWVASARQRRTEVKLQGVQAKTAEQRANAHGRDINNLLSKARTFRHDGVSVKALQKNYGRSIGARAPGRFMSELARKAERAGGASKSVNVRQLKTSQYDHSTGDFVKKTLSERWHTFGDGRGRCQRDVYSAFLALHAAETADDAGGKGTVAWSYDREQLQTAWVALEPALKAKGLFVQDIPNESESTQGPLKGASIPRPRVACQLRNRKAPGLSRVPGAHARGVVRVEKLLKPAV